MARARLYILVMSLCVISSACAKKAKMRTVPRQTPSAAGLQASPQLPPPADETTPAPEPSPRRTEVAAAPAPAPAPAAPISRLDDDGEARRVTRTTPAPAPRRELRTEDGEVNRPRAHEVRRERRVEVVDCPPTVTHGPVIQAPRPRPQARPRSEQRGEPRQQFELDPRDVLHCRWEPTGKPMTYLVYNPVTKSASVQHGWPQKWNHYSNVRFVTGLPPYGEQGLSMVAKSGVAIAHLKPSGNGTIWYERNTSYPYESYFGQVPGAPQGEAIRGVCWTKSEPAVTNDPAAGF